MTNKNIFDAIRNVDEKFILSAALSEKAADRPGKILLKAIFSATAVILVVALSIGGFMMVGKDKTPDVEENKPKEDVFLYSLGQSSPGKVIGSMSAKDYGICDSAQSEDQVFDELNTFIDLVKKENVVHCSILKNNEKSISKFNSRLTDMTILLEKIKLKNE